MSTGFLLSSAARLRSKGLSWAPATPYAAPKLHDKGQSSKFYRAFDGIETEVARITEVGIFSTWLVYEFDSPLLVTNLKHYLDMGHPAVAEINHQEEEETNSHHSFMTSLQHPSQTINLLN